MMSNDDEDDELLQFVGGGSNPLQEGPQSSLGQSGMVGLSSAPPSDSGGLLHNMACDDDPPSTDDDREALLGDGERAAKYNFWSLQFYSQWFDVDQGDSQRNFVA